MVAILIEIHLLECVADINLLRADGVVLVDVEIEDVNLAADGDGGEHGAGKKDFCSAALTSGLYYKTCNDRKL